MHWLRILQETLFPMYCAVCGRPWPTGLCSDCSSKLPMVITPCARCGLPERSHHQCPRPWNLDQTFAPYDYAGLTSVLVSRLKYGKQAWIAGLMGELLHVHLPPFSGEHQWVAVPLHRWRLYARGFNQSHEIALALGRKRRFSIQCGVRRTRHTPPVAKMSARERDAALRGAFRWSGTPGRSVVLVDDVITTGATINALARCAREAGAKQVAAVAFSRVNPPAHQVRV